MAPVLGTVVALAPMAASPIGVGFSKKLSRGALSFLGALAVHGFLIRQVMVLDLSLAFFSKPGLNKMEPI